ncbi:MAG: hypothetical protein A2931_03680 [Candidatus Niyogibacteria bacterium RIFCSPLOWO2_01_FULL_45_48]|uniref:CDP-diacylglycerol--glycerol-3-phosphate 3-phosphatidyltransferase n=2 Tax=Candidatus Niyogiibacteriota TaxID=1817912 RepID=A0A1G2EWR2_9BACT|nr:MAG: hypothetical protein A2835_02290 [Candidatus Niyogibacteria bacterium RIFCSPHIGHO2_01_FULL_45_28]OGZ30183.1 MAG: hypothetical protein A3J00_00755 [Candidatus Niyogibacteria bacterium RIFCSPLOWO2_02_FULL_45_13]OGZ30929.1 MAG: hypothetical protein A2931_03680 [Candidatus Niyogibacteria bacterium RIFCSPLOWO2_01_FULL_45_48]
MTYADYASLVRIIFGPPFALILYLTVKFPGKYPALEEHWPFLISLIMFLVLALTDALDGRLAKKYGETRFGAFLDPLADKIFLWSYSAVFVFTVAWNAILPLVLLFVLDVWSTVDRVKWYGLREKEIRANKGGKRKMFFHFLAIALFLATLVFWPESAKSEVAFWDTYTAPAGWIFLWSALGYSFLSCWNKHEQRKE